MAMGGPTEDGDAEGGVFADINITPLTDIFLVLLIIFMVTTTAIAEQAADKGGFKVSLPKSGQGDATAARDLSVAILADGRVVVGGKVLAEGELQDLFAKAHARSAETLVLVQADEGVPHGRVVAVMDLARRAGLARLAIATRADAPR